MKSPLFKGVLVGIGLTLAISIVIQVARKPAEAPIEKKEIASEVFELKIPIPSREAMIAAFRQNRNPQTSGLEGLIERFSSQVQEAKVASRSHGAVQKMEEFLIRCSTTRDTLEAVRSYCGDHLKTLRN